ncbi:MOCOS [Symbiodinium sp. CCMP2592]|nr:MOCOS [Symbiodinium sp. CCMP2592]
MRVATGPELQSENLAQVCLSFLFKPMLPDGKVETLVYDVKAMLSALRKLRRSWKFLAGRGTGGGNKWPGVSERLDRRTETWDVRMMPRRLAQVSGISQLRFAYPAEENFAGQIFPLRWAAKIGSRAGNLRTWRVLLDAAKFTASHPLNLTEAQADFVTLSFYKLFGYPTGVGALIIRTQTAFELKKHYWGGGSVSLAGAGRTDSDDLKV